MKDNFVNRLSKYILLSLAAMMIVAGSALSAERMVVKATIANLRSGPGSKYEVLWQVEKYHPVLVIEKRKSWYKIKDFEGDMAWIHKSLLGNINGVITIKAKCNVRSKPNKTGKILFTVERGVPFKVLKRSGDWIRIEHADGEIGWIYKSLVW
ncbi:MAG: SH3 domain-containing protein [Desulfobacteraceae bacterium]|nr:SH3 domain-containing protein [Desulfobacteraceae bacterium]